MVTQSGVGEHSVGAHCEPKVREEIARQWLARVTDLVESLRSIHFDVDRLRRYGVGDLQAHSEAESARKYLLPLLKLLAQYVRTGENRYFDAYLDERLRYAPHRASLETRVAFFNELLSLDEHLLVDALPEGKHRRAASELLRTLHAPLRELPHGQPMRVLAFGDCLMNEVRVSLVGACHRAGIPLDFRMLYFSAAAGRALDVAEALTLLKGFPADLIAFSFLSYKGIAPYALLLNEANRLDLTEIEARAAQLTGLMGGMLQELREHTDAPFLVHNASGLPLDALRKRIPFAPPISPAGQRALDAINASVRELVTHTPKTILLDEAAVAARHGYRVCEERLIAIDVMPKDTFFHTALFGQFLADPYLDVVRSYLTLSRTKVLLVDFDNTLWDGVMAEGSVRHRHNVQRLLHRLKEAGLLLVAVSKNDPKNIRWSEMILQPDDFVLHKLSWNLKAQSIEEAAQQLDLGLDSFVLLDDNPTERELVRIKLPSVRTLDPNDPRDFSWLERMLAFPNARQTEEARSRTELYRQQVSRREILQGKFDYASMMTSLELRAHFGNAGRDDLDRLAELVQRTNQFNTTTIRYSKPELLELLRRPDYGVYVTRLADKFGTHGLAAVAIVRRAGNERVIESFIMSCRAMGFELERFVLRSVLDAEGGPGRRFVGRFVPTDRNTPARSLFCSNGFSQRPENEWILEPHAPKPEKPAWFREEQRAATGHVLQSAMG